MSLALLPLNASTAAKYRTSNWLCSTVEKGTVLRARGPIGKFCYDLRTDHKHLIMVAGGSAVTPFISMLREYQYRLGQVGAPDKITLLVSYRSKQDLICWKKIVAKTERAKVFGTDALRMSRSQPRRAAAIKLRRLCRAGLMRLWITPRRIGATVVSPKSISNRNLLNLERRWNNSRCRSIVF